ncbi:MAG TPA: zf-HC2 domain-containing protein [Capsulimonadaceae bacterium]|nr:zf-HC2 domain-containing protein [Capsulimonadaceae bacterium]
MANIMQDGHKKIWQWLLIGRKSSCERYEKLASLYADGFASEKEARLVEAHIAGCADCRALLSSIRVTSGALVERPAPSVPADLSERLRMAITQERAQEQARISASGRRPLPRGLAPRLAFAGMVASLGIIVFVAHDLRSLPKKEPVAIKPAQVALQPKAISPVLPVAPAVSPAPVKTASSSIANNHPVLPTISHRRNSGDKAELANFRLARSEPEVVSPSLAPMIEKRTAPSHTSHSAQTRVAFNPPAPGMRNHTSHPANEQVAKAFAPVLPDEHPDVRNPLPPTVNSSTGGEQPTVVAEQPHTAQVQPAVAAPDESPRARLASNLKNLANNSSQAVQQVATVAAYEQRRTEFSGSLPIVGSSLR